MEFKPTPEQESVIEAVSYNERVKIKAFAGAGKTSTLRLIAEHFSRKKILYLAFNASVSAESKGKFPPNVFVRTVNSLAYKYISATTDLSKLSPGLKAKTIGDEYAINDDYVCRAAISAFEAYCNSDVKILDRAGVESLLSVDRNFRDDFFTLQQRSTIVKPGTENGTTPDPKFLSKVAELASRIWSRMENGRQGLTHSYYFKMFVNNVEQFIEDNRRELKFDIVMLDEAQDSNRATLHIFEALPGQKIMVGDPHQSIYSFRGASNLMDTFEADEELVLSTTFRFGKSIAKEANMVLGTYKREPVPISSFCADPGVVLAPGALEQMGKTRYGIIRSGGTYARLARTNAKLIEEFNALRQAKVPCRFIRDPESFFQLALSVMNFRRSEFEQELEKRKLILDGIQDKWITKFPSYEDLKLYAKLAEDQELLSTIRLLDRFGSNIYALYSLAKASFKNEAPEKFVALASAHTSKGLEWDHVDLLDDFKSPIEILVRSGFLDVESFLDSYSRKSSSARKANEELNLLYVAITRAKKTLQYRGESLFQDMDSNTEDNLKKRFTEVEERVSAETNDRTRQGDSDSSGKNNISNKFGA